LDRVRVIDFRPGDFRTGFNESAKVAGRGKAFERAWKVICERLSSSPQPAVAAERLIRALERGESGTVRAGTIFQRVAAPFFARFSSGEMQRRANRAYYKLGA
ncbi:MAG: short-chain dehydrogenase, partial [Verrucomicrobiota bacterium]